MSGIEEIGVLKLNPKLKLEWLGNLKVYLRTKPYYLASRSRLMNIYLNFGKYYNGKINLEQLVLSSGFEATKFYNEFWGYIMFEDQQFILLNNKLK